ncbi:MAG TPA: FkbM family methyltransferase [Alphaproteobacteria bacterium]|nr:FkbM family methyltransferase [Alphaproteobacteria bacterium]
MTQAAASFTSSQKPEKLLVKARHGQFVVIGEDLVVSLSLMYYGEYHEHEWQFVKRFIDYSQVIVDAGANLGTFTVPFSKAVGPYGKVISFEPQPLIYECLRETIALNKLENVELHQACLGAAPGEFEIPEPDYNTPGNFSGVPFDEPDFDEVRFSQHRIRARCVTLDSVLNGRRLDFLKIDVEGMELEVMQGGAGAISKYLPVIYLENNRLQKSPALISFLMQRGYRMWWHTGPFFNPHNFFKRPDNVYGKRNNINMIAIPPRVDAGLIPQGLLPVQGPHDHIMDETGKVTPSPANDVTGI